MKALAIVVAAPLLLAQAPQNKPLPAPGIAIPGADRRQLKAGLDRLNVVDITSPPDQRWPGKIAAAGFFGEKWELQPNDGR